jgi:hypothetical protein
MFSESTIMQYCNVESLPESVVPEEEEEGGGRRYPVYTMGESVGLKQTSTESTSQG